MSEVADYYDDYTKRQSEFGINGRHRSIMRFLAYHGLKSTDRVLEIGAGIGTQTSLLADYLSEGSIVANDISPKSVDIMRKRLADHKHVSFITGDIVQQDISGEFDAVVCPDVLEHIPLADHAALFKKLDQVVTEAGAIYIHIPHPFIEDWMARKRPDLRQVIDQPIYASDFTENLKGTNFYIHHLESYELFHEQVDYQFIVLKRKREVDYKEYVNPGIRFHKRVMNRLKLAAKVLIKGDTEDAG